MEASNPKANRAMNNQQTSRRERRALRLERRKKNDGKSANETTLDHAPANIGDGVFLSLPQDTLLRVCVYLTPPEIEHMRGTCRSLWVNDATGSRLSRPHAKTS